MTSKYSGSEWVESCYSNENPPRKMSDFGRKVADLLGQVYQGIYHIERDILRADLSTPDYISLTLSAFRDYSNFDGSTLTMLVVMCHDAGIRFELQPAGPKYFRFLFHHRNCRTGSTTQRMPTIEEHIKMIRENYWLPELAMDEKG